MNLLVTGGCGFIGSNLAAEGLARGMRVTVLDNLYRVGGAENLEWLRSLGPVTFARGDIRNDADVRAVVEDSRPDAIFHLAGQVAMTTSLREPTLDFEVNAGGTQRLLETVRSRCPGAPVVFSSTNKVYGDLEQFTYAEEATRYRCVERPNGFAEDTALSFHSPYGCSKGAADQYMLDYARMFGLKTIVFRHSSVYGGRQRPTVDQGWVAWFCKVAAGVMAGAPPETSISGNGKQVRDVLHVSDVVDLYFSAIERVEGTRGRAFNIGGGIANSMSLVELLDLLAGVTGKPWRITRGPPRESDQRFFVADVSRVASAVGWRPRVDARTGILRLVEEFARG